MAGKFRSRKIIEEFSDVATGRLAKREAYIAFEDLQQDRAWRLEAGHITDRRTGAAGALGSPLPSGLGHQARRHSGDPAGLRGA